MSVATDPDEPLMAELRGLFADVDPVPPLVLATAKASLGRRRLDADLDADLAELLRDSVLEEEPFAVRRGRDAPARAVTFSSTGRRIDIEVYADDPERTLLGRLLPPAPATIEIQMLADAPLTAETDRLGRFRVQLPAGGPVRLRVMGPPGPGRPPVETHWITV